MTINEMKDRAYKIACEHGWYDEERPDYMHVLLVITELSEAVNADRKKKYAQREMFERESVTPQTNPEEHWCHCYRTFIKDTVEDELADAVIRILSFAGSREECFSQEALDADVLRKAVGEYEKARNEAGYSPVEFPMQMFTLIGELVGLFDDTENVSMEEILQHIFMTAHLHGIDLHWYIEQKLKYNESRPYKHGKTY